MQAGGGNCVGFSASEMLYARRLPIADAIANPESADPGLTAQREHQTPKQPCATVRVEHAE